MSRGFDRRLSPLIVCCEVLPLRLHLYSRLDYLPGWWTSGHKGKTRNKIWFRCVPFVSCRVFIHPWKVLLSCSLTLIIGEWPQLLSSNPPGQCPRLGKYQPIFCLHLWSTVSFCHHGSRRLKADDRRLSEVEITVIQAQTPPRCNATISLKWLETKTLPRAFNLSA